MTICIAVAAAVLATRGGHQTAQPHTTVTTAPSPTTPATTTTTVAKAAAVFLSGDSQGARYGLVRAGADIELISTSPCWVQVRAGTANGTVVFESTLRPGERHPLPATGPVWLRLGNPAGIAIKVNGLLLALARPATDQPYNVQFVPAS